MDPYTALAQRDLRGMHILLSGVFWLTPQRQLKRHLRALGATIAKYTKTKSKKNNRKIHVLVIGSTPDPYVMEAARKNRWVVWSETFLNDVMELLQDTNERLQELRLYCHSDITDAETWRQICITLERWPLEDNIKEAIDYVQHYGDRWSDKDRMGLKEWYKRARSGTPDPRLSVIRYANLNIKYKIERRGIRNLLRALPPELTGLRLTRTSPIPRQIIKTLKEVNHLSNLRYLNLTGLTVTNQTILELGHHQFKHLEVLDLYNRCINSGTASKLKTNPALSNLREIQYEYQHSHRAWGTPLHHLADYR